MEGIHFDAPSALQSTWSTLGFHRGPVGSRLHCDSDCDQYPGFPVCPPPTPPVEQPPPPPYVAPTPTPTYAFTARALPGRVSALSVFHSKSVLYGGFV